MAIAALAAPLLVAGILYFVFDARSAKAGEDLELFREYAAKEARKAQVASLPPNIAAMWPAEISAAHRERIEAMQIGYHSLLYRRGLALGFVTRGAVLLLALGCFYAVVKFRAVRAVAP